MREEFTTQLRKVLDEAQAAARSLNQEFVGTEHLTLGMLACEPCEVARAMRLNEIDVEEFRQHLLDDLPKGGEPPVVAGSLPLSPKAKRAINEAIVKAQVAQESRVSSRFVMLSLLEEPETAIRQALRDIGADVDQLQRLLAKPPAEPEE